MSPELAYLSQSLFMHRPDLAAMPSPFLAASAAAAAAVASASASASTAGATPGTSQGLEPGQLLSPALSSSSSSSTPSGTKPTSASSKLKSSSSSSSLTIPQTGGHSTLEKSSHKQNTHGGDRRSKDRLNSSSSSSKHKDSVSSKDVEKMNNLSSQAFDFSEKNYDSDRLPDDPSGLPHFMDDDRKKRIAEHIRKRVGMQESMAALLSKHGFKHEDLPQSLEECVKEDFATEEKDGEGSRSRSNSSSSKNKETEAHRMMEKLRLEAELQRQEQALNELKHRYSVSEEASGLGNSSSNFDESCDSFRSEGDDSKLDNISHDEQNQEHDDSSGGKLYT